MQKFLIMPTDNQSEIEGTAIFTQYYLQEVETGNCFPAFTSRRRDEPYYFMAKTQKDIHNQEIVIGKMAGSSSYEDAVEHCKSLIK